MIKLNQILKNESVKVTGSTNYIITIYNNNNYIDDWSSVTNYSITKAYNYSVTNNIISTGVTNYSVNRNSITIRKYKDKLKVLRGVTGRGNSLWQGLGVSVTVLRSPFRGAYCNTHMREV